MSLPSKPADPDECHPAYERRRAMLLEWLDARGPYADLHVIHIPFPAVQSFVSAVDVTTASLTFPVRTLERYKVMRPAAYVGEPFHWRWLVAVDDLGRQVTTDSWKHYDGPSAPKWVMPKPEDAE